MKPPHKSPFSPSDGQGHPFFKPAQVTACCLLKPCVAPFWIPLTPVPSLLSAPPNWLSLHSLFDLSFLPSPRIGNPSARVCLVFTQLIAFHILHLLTCKRDPFFGPCSPFASQSLTPSFDGCFRIVPQGASPSRRQFIDLSTLVLPQGHLLPFFFSCLFEGWDTSFVPDSPLPSRRKRKASCSHFLLPQCCFCVLSFHFT